MYLVVVTRGRTDRQITLPVLKDVGYPVIVVCPYLEAKVFEARYKWLDSVMGVTTKYRIGRIRQHILSHAREAKLVMFDDDLRFRQKQGSKFARADNITDLVSEIDRLLDDHAHVGLRDEFRCDVQKPDVTIGGRYSQVMAYNRDLWPVHPPLRFRLNASEEHDMNLQLTTRGFPPAIINTWTKGSTFYAKGGCSIWRTQESEQEQHEKFMELWPDYVKLAHSPHTASGTRVVVAWQKALKDGRLPVS